MQKIIEKFVKEHDHGLCLLDCPTGFGKSYNAARYIANQFTKQEKPDALHYIVFTDIKSNLFGKKIREFFEEAGQGGLYDEIAITLDSLTNYFCDGILKLTEDDKKILENVLDVKEYRFLETAIKNAERYKNNMDQDPVYKDILYKLVNEDEKTFRNIIKKYLRKKKTKDEKIEAIRKEKKYQWIGKIYPCVFSSKKKILLMSTHKFVYGNDTLVEPRWDFLRISELKKAVVIIDEIDTVKSTLENIIIKNQSKNKQDIIQIYQYLYGQLMTQILPQKFLNASNDDKKTCTNLTIINKLKEAFQDTVEKYHIDCTFKTDIKLEEQSKESHFIFTDGHRFITPKESDEVWVKYNPTERFNLIYPVSKTGEETVKEGNKLSDILQALRRNINFFISSCRRMSQNLCDPDELKDLEIREAKINTILDLFSIPYESELYIYLINKIHEEERKRILTSKKNPDMSCFYYTGYQVMHMINSQDHELSTKIYMKDFHTTPEAFLMELCLKARVIGLSATATIETVIKNFDINFLRKELGEDFYVLSPKEIERLKKQFYTRIGNYDKCKYVPVCVSENSLDNYIKNKDYSSEEIREIEKEKLSDQIKYLAKKIASNLEQSSESSVVFEQKCIEKIYFVIYKLMEEKIHSAIIMRNKKNIDFVKHLNTSINNIHFVEISGGSNMISQKIEQFKTHVMRLPTSIFTNYKSFGQGINVQYVYDQEKEEVVKIRHDDAHDGEKDVQAIYTECPTHIVSTLSKNELATEEALYHMLFQTYYLRANDEISEEDFTTIIKKTFEMYCSKMNKRFATKDLNDIIRSTKSYNNAAIRILIQAIGRLCRTGIKSPVIYLFFDEEIVKKIDFSHVHKLTLINPEFCVYVDAINAIKEQLKTSKNTVKSEEIRNTAICNQFIQDILNQNMNHWSAKSVEQWETVFGTNLLKYPGYHADNPPEALKSKFYIKLPKKQTGYSYSVKNDNWHKVRISFNPDELQSKVNDEIIHLSEIKNISGLQEHFEKNDFCTKFEEWDYILNPVIYNNCYKRALGEEIGHFILDSTGIKLKRIEDLALYEYFDFVLEEDERIFVDIKYYQEIDLEDTKYKQILEKAKKCNAKKVFIINIMGNSENNYKTIRNNDEIPIIRIPYLYDLKTHQISEKMLNILFYEINNTISATVEEDQQQMW